MLPALWDERTLFNSLSRDVKGGPILGFILFLPEFQPVSIPAAQGFQGSLFAVQ
jgi:hypothetical protein